MSDAGPHRAAAGALRLLRRRGRSAMPAWRATAAVAVLAAGAGLVVAPAELAPTTRGGVVQPAGWALEAAFTASLVVAAFVVFRAFDALFRTAGARALQCLPVPGGLLVRDRAAVLVEDAARAAVVLAAFVAPACTRPGGELAVYAVGFAIAAPFFASMVGFGVLAHAGTATSEPTSSAARALDGFGEVTGGVWHLAPGAAFAAAAACLLALRLGVGELAAGDGVVLRSAQVALLVPTVGALALAVTGARAWARNAHRIAARFVDAEIATADDRWIETSRARFEAIGRDALDVLTTGAALQLQRRHPVLLASAWGAAVLVAAVAWATGGAVSPAGAAVGLVAWFAAGVAPGRLAEAIGGFGAFGAASLVADTPTVARARQLAATRTARRLLAPLMAPALAWGLHGVVWLAVVLPGGVSLLAITHRGAHRRLAALPVAAAAVPALAAAWWPDDLVAVAVAAGLGVTLGALPLVLSSAPGRRPR